MAIIREFVKPIDFNAPINFIKFKGPNHISKSIHDDNIALEDVEKEQIKLKSDLACIKQGPWKYKSPQQKHKQYVILKVVITQEKKLPKCLMIMLKICLKAFMSRNNEQDLKY